MGIEAAQQTVVAMCNLGWGTMSDVNDLDSIRALGHKGEKLSETVSAAKPHDDAFSEFYKLFDLHQSVRGTASLMQRMITAEMAKGNFNFSAELDLADCHKNLTTALKQNEDLLRNYKELCVTLQACRTDETSRNLGHVGAAITKLLNSSTGPLIKAALGTATVAGLSATALATAGVSVGALLLAGGIACTVSHVAETKEKDLRQNIGQRTEEIGRQSNQATAVVLGVMRYDAEFAEFDKFMQEAIQAAKNNFKPLVGMDVLTDAQQLRGIQQGEYKYTPAQLEKALQSAKQLATNLTQKLLATVDEAPVEKKSGALTKVKNVFRSKKTLQDEKDQDVKLQQTKINSNRAAIDSRIAAITEKVQILEGLVNELKGKGSTKKADDTLKFHSGGQSSSAALLQRLQTPEQREAQKVTIHMPEVKDTLSTQIVKVTPASEVKPKNHPSNDQITVDDFKAPPTSEAPSSLRL